MKNTARPIFNLCLTFGRAESRVLVDYSTYLSTLFRTDFQLGNSSLPHLTLVQFEADEADARTVFQEVAASTPPTTVVSLMGLTLIPTKDDAVWLEALALKTQNLLRLHTKAVQAVGSKNVHSGTGDSYRPHVTLAKMVGGHVLPQFRVDEKAVRIKNASCNLGLGISGSNYQLAALL